jgi:hypothetical protein
MRIKVHYNTVAKGGEFMPDAKKRIKRYATIVVHPPEAEEIAETFSDSRTTAEADLTALEGIAEALDAGWEGGQKVRFLEGFRTAAGRIRTIMLPQLLAAEKKYRFYTVEKTVEIDDPG